MKVYEKLAKKRNWTKGAFAKNIFGMKTNFNNKFAYKWCLLGAVKVCYGEGNYKALTVEKKIYDYLEEKFGYMVGVIEFNDFRITTHDDILKLCRDLNI